VFLDKLYDGFNEEYLDGGQENYLQPLVTAEVVYDLRLMKNSDIKQRFQLGEDKKQNESDLEKFKAKRKHIIGVIEQIETKLKEIRDKNNQQAIEQLMTDPASRLFKLQEK